MVDLMFVYLVCPDVDMFYVVFSVGLLGEEEWQNGCFCVW
jgi:hypothetical protein